MRFSPYMGFDMIIPLGTKQGDEVISFMHLYGLQYTDCKPVILTNSWIKRIWVAYYDTYKDNWFRSPCITSLKD